ncbi:MAG: hypothetical protein WBC50_05805 [Dehalococcoidales bacterium]
MDRQSAKNALAKHHSAQVYKPEDYYTNVVNADGKYLKTYIPYIGEDYFNTKPRVLIYAMAQNLARAPGLIRAWHNKPKEGMFRQYYHSEKLQISIHPYDTGHLKIIAALVLSVYPGTNYSPNDNVHNKIAVTNFVKFSFYREGKNGKRLDANPPSGIYDVMWENYCKYEIELLKPDVVVGVGNDVAYAIRRNYDSEVKMLKIAFPGRLNLNSRYIPEGKQLIESGYNHMVDIARIQELVQGTPDKDKKIAKAIKTDWYYFREMEVYFKEVLSKPLN